MLFDKTFLKIKKIIKSNALRNQQGGEIRAESEPGKGTTFYFTIIEKEYGQTFRSTNFQTILSFN
jgi:light-regulated signal transduction histidine kinase (bacteriophytochrome)